MFKEFQKFLQRGNVLDLAVAVVLGAAFGKIVASLVNDILMPPISLLLGETDFKELVVVLRGDVTLNYGNFLQNIIEFVIIAFSVFLIIRTINRLKEFRKKTEEAVETPPSPPEPTESEKLLAEIRDLLKNPTP